MPSYKCSICGKVHDAWPMDISYSKPADYYKVPLGEREARIKFTTDLCSIDNTDFYIRGILALPVMGCSDEFRWGLWARVEEHHFKRYVELWNGNIPEGEPAFVGYLSGRIKYYADSDMLEVMVHLQSGNQRPRFEVVADRHPLGIDQRNGISIEQAHSFVEPLLKFSESQS